MGFDLPLFTPDSFGPATLGLKESSCLGVLMGKEAALPKERMWKMATEPYRFGTYQAYRRSARCGRFKSNRHRRRI